MTSEDSNVSHKVLEQNCREDWPLWTCIFANVSGLCSTALWFIVLLPQLWKNFRRKSVKGLSVLWATANFTASLINIFFVFLYAKIPLYGQISSIYSPVLEFGLLIQFWIYGRYPKIDKIIYASVCFLLWGVVIAVQLIFKVENYVEYVAITLWCIETFPQVLLNMKLQSTSGQATVSVFIAVVGKTTDFLATNILVMPLQYVIMRYYSSSVAYVNGFQVAWYYGQDIMTQPEDDESTNQTHEDSTSFDQSSNSLHNDHLGFSVNSSSTSNLTAKITTDSGKCTLVIRIISMIVISCLLLMCVVGFVLNIQSFFGLFAPASIGLVMFIAHVYFTKYKRLKYSLPRDSRWQKSN